MHRLTAGPGRFWLAGALLWCLALPGWAEYRFHLLDSDGQPLPDVIVSLAYNTPPADEQQLAVMDQVDRAFKPHVLAVRAGDRVEFPNSDNIRHHVYSFSEPRIFEIRLYADRPEKPLDFPTPGIVVLGCNIHDDMLGYIYVAPENSRAYVTDSRGEVAVDDISDVTSVTLWHERLSVDETYQRVISSAELKSYVNSENQIHISLNTVIPDAPTEQDTHSHGLGNSMRR